MALDTFAIYDTRMKYTNNTDRGIDTYYRKKFTAMAGRLAEQIEYDYDATLEKCRKKQEKEERNSDIGEDAMVLAVKRGAAKKEDPKKEAQIDHESNSEVSRK